MSMRTVIFVCCIFEADERIFGFCKKRGTHCLNLGLAPWCVPYLLFRSRSRLRLTSPQKLARVQCEWAWDRCLVVMWSVGRADHHERRVSVHQISNALGKCQRPC